MKINEWGSSPSNVTLSKQDPLEWIPWGCGKSRALRRGDEILAYLYEVRDGEAYLLCITVETRDSTYYVPFKDSPHHTWTIAKSLVEETFKETQP